MGLIKVPFVFEQHFQQVSQTILRIIVTLLCPRPSSIFLGNRVNEFKVKYGKIAMEVKAKIDETCCALKRISSYRSYSIFCQFAIPIW